MRLDVMRDLLDAQLVDREGTKMGRVDGIVIDLRDGEPAVIDHLQLGGVVLAQRIHPRLASLVERFRRWAGVRREAVQEIPWSLVGEVTQQHVKVSLSAIDTAAFDWERWLRKHVVEKLLESRK